MEYTPATKLFFKKKDNTSSSYKIAKLSGFREIWLTERDKDLTRAVRRE
jgi:hypothetical protein